MGIAATTALLFVFAFILAGVGAEEVHAAGTIGTLNGTSYSSFKALTNDLEDNCKNKTVTIEMKANWNAANSKEFDRRLVIPEGCKATLNMHGYVINRNHAYDFHWYEDETEGELIYVDSKASLTINGATTEEEKKREHKNVAVFTSTAKDDNANGRKTIYGALLTGGVSSDGSGGIHIKDGCNVTLNDVTIAGCNADKGFSIVVGIKSGYGGGVFVKGKGTKLNLNNSVVTGCHAFRDGGGIYAGNYDNVDITLNNSHVDSNFASDDGGGINMDGENISLVGKNGSTVSKNQCTDMGGGVYIWNDNAAVRGLTIEGNKAYWGGGVYTTEEDITLSGLTIRNNTADFQGGGIFIENDGNEINSCTITGNSNYGVRMDSGCDKDMLVSGKTVIKDNKKGNLTLQDDSDIIDFAEDEAMDVHIGYVTNPTNTEGFAISHMQLDYSNQLTADDKDYVIVYSYRQVDQDKTGRRLRYIKKSNQSDDYGRVTEKPTYKKVKIKNAGPSAGSPQKVYAGGEQAGSGDQYALTKVFLHHQKTDGGRDTDYPFYYTDGFFYGDPYVYNDHLATASWNLAFSGNYLRRWNNDYTYKHQGARQFMADIGCPDQMIYVNDSLVSKPGLDTIGVCIGSKKLQEYDGSKLKDTGDILMAVTIRGGGYEAEWGSNVTLGSGNDDRGADKKGEALGFSQAADQTMEAIDYYINRYGLQDAVKEGKVRFWISGFSRAGATANITSKRLVEKYANGSEGKQNLVFSYPCEAPKGGTDAAEQLSDKTKYYCIHNIVNSGDVVPLVAPGEMGFKRYGVDHYIPGTVINAKTREEYNGIVKKTEKTPAGSTPADGISKVTTYADNSYLDTNKDMKSQASDKYNQYVTRRDDMVKHLATLDHTILYNDYFHPYGTAADWWLFGKLGDYDGTKVEEFLPHFMAFLLQEATGAAEDDDRSQAKVRVNRGKYAADKIKVNGKEYASLQKVARDYFGAKKDYLTPITDKGSAIYGAMNWFFTTGISIRELYDNVLGEYYDLSEADKEKYIKYFWDLADGQGAFKGLSEVEYNTIKEDWFTIADTALHFVDGDYCLGARSDLGYLMPGHPNGTDAWINYPTIELIKSRLVYALTMFENMDMIVGINHVPEVGIAWTRTYDDLYSKDNGEPKDFTEYKVNWVDDDNPDNVDGYTVDAPSAFIKEAEETDAGNTYSKLIESNADQYKDKNNVDGDTKVFLETGKIYDDTASDVSTDTKGEAIFYDLYDITNGSHPGEQLAKKQIYRAGVDLSSGDKKKTYKIVSYALSYGVKSNESTYFINVRNGAHDVTKTIDHEREGFEPRTDKYTEGERISLTATGFGDVYFDHWEIKCVGSDGVETDVTGYLPGLNRTEGWTGFTMPETGAVVSGYTWPANYKLTCIAHYLPCIKEVTASELPVPEVGVQLSIGARISFDIKDGTHALPVTWKRTGDDKGIVCSGKADYETAYSAVIHIPKDKGFVFAQQEYLKALYDPETGGVTTSIQKNNDGSVTMWIHFPQTQSKPKYTVTFMDGKGEGEEHILKTQEVELGGSATAPDDPEWDGYAFMGWDKTFTDITEDLTVTAQWGEPAPQIFKVAFVDRRGEFETVLKTDYVLEGGSATPPDDPQWKNHTFEGWDKEFSYVTEDMEILAVWEENEPLEVVVKPYDCFFEGYMTDYEITYYGYPGETIDLVTPVINDYEFVVWDRSLADGGLIDEDHRTDRVVKIEIPEYQTENMEITSDYTPVVNSVDVNVGVPECGKPIQTKAKAKTGDKPATMAIKIGDMSYEVHPDCVAIDWTPDSPVEDDQHIAENLTTYTAMVRLMPKEDKEDHDYILIKGEGDTEYKEATDLFLYSDNPSVTVNGEEATLIKVICEVDYTFPMTMYTLEKVISPADITDVPWGAGQDDVKSLLPSYSEIMLEDGTVMNAEVEWDDPAPEESGDEYGPKTWRAEGEVKLPYGVNNKKGEEAIDLKVSVKVFVDAAESASTPEASPEPGIYMQDQKVTLSTSTEGAIIWYSTDGSDPSDADNPNRKKYIEGEEIPINRADATEDETDADGVPTERKQITLKAIAIKEGIRSSGVRTYTYIFANEVEIPDGKTLAFNDDHQVGVKGDRFYTLEAISEGVTIDEEGNAIAKEPGTYKAKAKLAGPDYKWITDVQGGTSDQDQTIEFAISINDITGAKIVLSKTDLTYNGKKQKPSIKAIGGYTLKAGTDYTVTWSNASSKNVGTYTAIVTGIGNYTGFTKATYQINPKGTKIKKLKKAKKAITVKWKKQKTKMSKSRITGYQIQVATDKAFTENMKTVNVKGYKKTSKIVKKLQAKKKYYVHVRTYMRKGSVKYYSPWSKTKTVKTR